MDDRGAMKSQRVSLAALLGAALVLLGGLLLLRPRHGAEVPASEATLAAPATPAVAVAAPLPVEATKAPEPREHTELAGYDPTKHAHPITEEHLRLYRETDLLDGAWLALRKRDFSKARDLVATHRSEYSGSKEHMDEGLLLLADCMESPGAETRARAQQFYDSKTYSPMRRRIRRLCLEQVAP